MSDKTQWPEISIWKYVCTFTIADRNLILTILFTPLLIYLGDYELTDKVGGQRSHIHGTISPYRQVQYSRMIDIEPPLCNDSWQPLKTVLSKLFHY